MQLPENEENIVEDQPTEAVDSDADDNENQEDFSEEIEDEDTESSLENEDYPGEDVVEIINLRGETTTVYKLVDGRYMDCTNTVYIYDGRHMDRYKWCGVEPGSDIVLSVLSESKNRLLNRHNLYYNIFIAKLTWR